MSESATIVVDADGVDERPPDLVVARLVVDARADSASTARASVDERTATVFETLSEYGLPDTATRTVRYHVGRPNPHGPQRQTQNGPEYEFEAMHVVRVETPDLDGVGDLLTACADRVDAGIDEVSFTLERATHREAYNAALADATAVAQDRAETLAAATGRSLGTIEEVVTRSQGRALSESSRTESAGSPEATVDPRPGPVETTATVRVTYELE